METTQNTNKNPSAEANNALSLWTAEQLARLMTEHGVQARQQAGLLSELCGLSLSQARRKLRGAMWSFDEVLAVTRRFGASLDQIFSSAPRTGITLSENASGNLSAPFQEATFLMDQLTVPCRVRLGEQIVGIPNDDELLTAQNQEGWYVGTKKKLDQLGIEEPCYHADQALLTPQTAKPSIRIAILDDERGTSETLCEWFNAIGYSATAFTSGKQLLSSHIENYVAFVIDFMLANGESSQAIIRKIRQTLPEAPIVLLTGKLRDGQASESELTTMLRTSNVIFFEKPVRPSVLAASIEKELDQIAHRRAN